MSAAASHSHHRRAAGADNARRLIEAAREVFSRQPPGSLGDVASLAGVGIATLYRHFPSREALMRGVLVDIFEREVADVLEGVRVDQIDGDQFVDVVERVVELVAEIGGVTSQNLAALTDELLARFVAPFETLLLAAQEAGTIRRDLVVQDIGPLLLVTTSGLSAPQLDRRVRRRFTALVLDALRPGLESRLPPFPDGMVGLGLTPDRPADAGRSGAEA